MKTNRNTKIYWCKTEIKRYRQNELTASTIDQWSGWLTKRNQQQQNSSQSLFIRIKLLWTHTHTHTQAFRRHLPQVKLLWTYIINKYNFETDFTSDTSQVRCIIKITWMIFNKKNNRISINNNICDDMIIEIIFA